ncbi:MAG TPA: hypothetical protein VK525_04290 [Candidatus Saccharimonadales bacterium]|nr:hypothetical protein [Candidatus Saccharimonadales bacterium]
MLRARPAAVQIAAEHSVAHQALSPAVQEALADATVPSAAQPQESEKLPGPPVSPPEQLPELLEPQEALQPPAQRAPLQVDQLRVRWPELLQVLLRLALARRAWPQQAQQAPPRGRALQVSEQPERPAQPPPAPRQVSSAQP